MKARELAKELEKYPDMEVLVKVVNDWVEVHGVTSTGQHRNAITFNTIAPGLGGVIVREPEEGV